MTRRSFLLLPAAATLLASCTAQGSFPSLEPRAVERQYGALPPATGPCATARQAGCNTASAETPPPAPPADDPALRARVAELVDAARQGDQDFAKRLLDTADRIAHAGATGSDAWVGAQQELSRLESARSKTLDAVAGLEDRKSTRLNSSHS